MKKYTAKQIEEWKRKAEKWDALNEKVAKYYTEDGDEDAEEEDLASIGIDAAMAFGYL